jgi:hypothetical protein
MPDMDIPNRGLVVVLVCGALLASGCGAPSGRSEDRPALPVTTEGPRTPSDRVATTTDGAASSSATATTAPAATATTVAAPTTTSSPTTTTIATDPMSPEELLDVVAAHYDALNEGTISILGVGTDQRRAAALNAQFEADCRITGDEVACTEQVTDDFYGPAGFVFENDVSYVAQGTEALLISGDDSCFAAPGHGLEPGGSPLRYVQAFDRWLYETHPDTVRWIWLYADEGLPNWLDGRPCQLYSIEGVVPDPRLVEFVREFVAQSDDYPLEPPLVISGGVFVFED